MGSFPETFKGTGSRFSACSSIKLLFSNLLLNVYQGSQSVFQSRSVFQSNLKWDRGVLKSQKKLVDYANTTNVEFIVDPKVLFHG